MLLAFGSAAWGGWFAIIIGLGSALLFLAGIPGLWSIPAGVQFGPLLMGIWVITSMGGNAKVP